jgi:hypothetical protein
MRRTMLARLVLGFVAALRAALIYGEGADLSTRRLEWPSWSIGELFPTRFTTIRRAQRRFVWR